MTRMLVTLVLLLAAPLGSAAAQDLFDLKLVVEGVYAAIAKPQYKLNCNAAVVVLDDSVLVVDTHSKPSAARALTRQIKALTDKPVKYVVNTHFHWDHYQGNAAYPNAWPAGVEIVSSHATHDNIERLGIPRVKAEIANLPAEIKRLKAVLAGATGAAQEAARDNLRQAEAYLAELKGMQVTLPTLTFERSLILRRKSRTVQLLWMGRAHTDGDVVVYLPKERLIATGDMLHGWVPYMGDSFPYDWIRTLEDVERLDFDYTVGGHGDVMRGKGTFQLWREYFTDLMKQTTEAHGRGETIETIRSTITAALSAKHGGRFATFTKESVVGNVEKAYRVVSGQHK